MVTGANIQGGDRWEQPPSRSHRLNQWPNLSILCRIEGEVYQEIRGEVRKYVNNNVTIGKEVEDNYSRADIIFPNPDALTILASHIGQDLPKDMGITIWSWIDIFSNFELKP